MYRRGLWISVVALAGTFLATGSAIAAPPSPPVITEPSSDHAVLNPADVHMEAGGFSDPDAGDIHDCSDWQIVTPASEVAWRADCVTGSTKVHIHFGDGEFVNSYAGRTSLDFNSSYTLRVRFQDSTGELSEWAERPFATSPEGPPGEPGGVPWSVADPDYTVEIVATGFQLPVNVAMVPDPGDQPGDPFLYVAELYGSIKVVTRDGTVDEYVSGLLNFNPTGNFPGSGEMGLTGLAVDPSSGDVLASMVYEDSSSAEDPKPHYAKVVRLHSDDGGRTASGQTTILDMFGEEQTQSHQISNLTITPDRELYVHTGDGHVPAATQDLEQFRGKVLRMDLDGDPLDDNPFYDDSDGITVSDYVFAYGFRNPFGGAWRAADEGHYEVDNGPSVDRFALVPPGANFGWDGTNTSIFNHALYNWNPSHAPVNVAFVQPETAAGSGFPAGKMDHAFVTESGPTWATGPQALGKRIVEFAPGAGGSFGAAPVTLVDYTGVGKATAAGLAAGADGLYFTDLYKDTDYTSPIDAGANLLRVAYEPDETAPDTTITEDPDALTNNPTPTFNFSSSEDNSTFECSIDQGTANFTPCSDPGPGATGSHTPGSLLADGAYSFRVRATDASDNTDSSPDTHAFTVDTTGPDTTIASGPAQGATIADRTPTFGFSSSEIPSTFECRVDGAAYSGCSSPTTTPALSDGHHMFEVRATDQATNTDPTPASRSFTIHASTPPPRPGDDRPPETTITRGPKAKTKRRKARFAFSADEPGSTFECALDGKDLGPCSSPFAKKVKRKRHTFEVVATDDARNTDPTPAEHGWKVKKRRK